MFLTPHSRVLTSVGIEIPFSNNFDPKFKTISGKWISYTSNGVMDTVAPVSKLVWEDKMKFNDPANKSRFQCRSWAIQFRNN